MHGRETFEEPKWSLAIAMRILPDFDVTVADLVGGAAPDPGQVAKTEDLFYCAHNAVRSGQMGGDTVPDWFDSMSDGGAIHERRRALTWAVSPGRSWSETDLST